MAQAMAQGLVDSDALSGEHIHACAGHFDKLKATAGRLGVNAYREAAEVVRASDFVVLAVKPYLVEQVVEPVRELLADKAVISVAAGRDFAFYEGVLAPNSRHLSTIPNTPIAVGRGVTLRAAPLARRRRVGGVREPVRPDRAHRVGRRQAAFHGQLHRRLRPAFAAMFLNRSATPA